ncbi:hypothetical protein WJX73_001634 [Symbiochloris irregularis]|uniref:Uncharacterized protein n=1 Tax=Symbiochloris irregularis TaxID=706552 RepID=A0AAW1PU30_9CHLO
MDPMSSSTGEAASRPLKIFTLREALRLAPPTSVARAPTASSPQASDDSGCRMDDPTFARLQAALRQREQGSKKLGSGPLATPTSVARAPEASSPHAMDERGYGLDDKEYALFQAAERQGLKANVWFDWAPASHLASTAAFNSKEPSKKRRRKDKDKDKEKDKLVA